MNRLDINPGWHRFPVGLPEKVKQEIGFVRREWDLGSERYIGMPFSRLAYELILASRFHPMMFEPETWIGNYHGGIFQVMFKIFSPNPHEVPGQIRKTGSGKTDDWISGFITPDNVLVGYNPMFDTELTNSGLAVGLCSRVVLNNLTNPGSDGGNVHFPMFDITKPPTPKNIEHLISEIRRRCKLEKFFVLRSSDHGMMVIGPELVREDHLLVIWNAAEGMNHFEVDGNDVWFDSRWHARSQQNSWGEAGLPNRYQVCGILRVTAAPPLKPEEPVVVAAGF